MNVDETAGRYALDRVLALSGLASAAVLAVFSFFFLGRAIFLVVSLLTFVACVAWLRLRIHSFRSLGDFRALRAGRSLFLILNAVFLTFFALSVAALSSRPDPYVRPIIYFVLTAVSAGVLSLQVLFAKEGRHDWIILAGIIAIGLSLAWSALSIFPTVLGIDPWWHQSFVVEMLKTGHVPEGETYSRLPIFHLLIGSTSLLTDSSYKEATLLAGSAIQIISNVLFVYLIARFIFNSKVGLLSALLVVIASSHIQMSFWIIPNSIAAVFIPAIVYLLLKVRRRRPSTAISLSMFFMAVLILTHTITALVLSIVLFVLWAGSRIHEKFRDEKRLPWVTLSISSLFAVAMFTWWSYASGHTIVLAELIRWGFSADYALQAVPAEIFAYRYSVPFPEQVFNQLGWSMFFALSFVGALYMISKRFGNPPRFAWALAGIVILAVAFMGLTTGRYFLEARWWYFSQIMLSIPLALTLILFVGVIQSRARKASLILVLVMVLSFLMSVSPTANIDNPTFSPNSVVRYALTDSELKAISRFSDMVDLERIMLDSTYGRFLYASTVDITLRTDQGLLSGELVFPAGAVILIRREIVEHAVDLLGFTYRLDYDPRFVLEQQMYSRIYDSGSVSGFTR